MKRIILFAALILSLTACEGDYYDNGNLYTLDQLKELKVNDTVFYTQRDIAIPLRVVKNIPKFQLLATIDYRYVDTVYYRYETFLKIRENKFGR